jgi:hypothetical protein
MSSSGGAGEEDTVDRGFAGCGDVLCGNWRRLSVEGGWRIGTSACRERDLVEDAAGRVRGDIPGEDAASDGGMGERLGCSACPVIAGDLSSGNA